MLLLVITNLFFLLLPECSSLDLPSYFPRCYLDDPDPNCIGKAANTLRPYISKGIKEIKFPSFSPLVVSNFKVDQESRLVNYTGTLWNFTVSGLDNYDITKVRYDPKTLTFNGTMQLESFSVISDYEIEGNLLSIPISGKGKVQEAFGPVNGTFEINGEIIKRKGIEHYNPVRTKVRFTIEDCSLHLGGLFEGNEELAQYTNDLLNRNSKMLIDATTPVFENLAEIGLMKLMKSLMLTVPYDKLFR